MLSGLKEVFEAAEERIKSPILGSIVIVFILMNWKVVYFVVFSGDIALMKFNYFDANTTANSLLWPIPLGFIAALAVPWVSFMGSFLVELPNRKMKLLQDQSAHKILQEKNKLATERENEKTIYESSLIDEAKRDLEIKNIEDDKIRTELEAKVAVSRSGEEKSDPQLLLPDELANYADAMSLEERNLIILLAKSREGKFSIVRDQYGSDIAFIVFPNSSVEEIPMGGKHRLRLRYEEAIRDLRTDNFIETTGNSDEFEITSVGYNLADEVEKKMIAETLF